MTPQTTPSPSTRPELGKTDRPRPVEVPVSAELAELANTWTVSYPPPAPSPRPAAETRVRFDRD